VTTKTAAQLEATGETQVETLRVLLVDDNASVLRFLASAVASNHCEVKTASTAEQALELLGDVPFDLVVSDIKMPGLSGLDLLRSIKGKQPSTPVVLITGVPSVNSAVFGLRHGAYDYLPKPFSVTEVRELINRLRRDRAEGNGNVTYPAGLNEELQRRQGGVAVLSSIGELALQGLEQDLFVEKVLEKTLQSLRCDAAIMLLRDAEGKFNASQLGQPSMISELLTLLHAHFADIVKTGGRETYTLTNKAHGFEALAALMIGRAPQPPAKASTTPGAPLLETEDLTVVDPDGIKRVDGVSLCVRAGEIVGIAGVAGNGQSELIEALVGLGSVPVGTIRLGGADVTWLSIAARRFRGLRHIPEDRLRLGAVAAFSASENALLGRQADADCTQAGLLRHAVVRAALDRWMNAYEIRPPDPERRFALFSGGNQQKLVVARELERKPSVLVVGQPTRGVDVGAAELIHARLLALRASGVGTLLVSADLDEIRLLSDRILVMCGGRIVGEVAPEATSERGLSLLMAGAEAA